MEVCRLSKSVLTSIRPQWCEKIASGKKTLEIRKSRPKLETPFKCYIYCTNVKSMNLEQYCKIHAKTSGRVDDWNGKVIGEFACDSYIGWRVNPLDGLYMIFPHELTAACLTGKDFEHYGAGKTLYGWHISALQIYDRPRELSEFWVERDVTTDYPPLTRLKRPPQSWCYVEALDAK